MAFIIVPVVVVILVIIVIAIYNSLIGLRNKTDEAFATMDVYLKKRYDLIPNLVETVKGYAAHERETLEKVIQARNMAISSQNLDERQQNENMLSGTLRSLFALSESYPQLKADGGFMQLQSQLQQLENEISQSRKYYNAVVKTLNTRVEMFPSNIVARAMGLVKYPYFMADELERQNIQVKF
jgi:LemA protein